MKQTEARRETARILLVEDEPDLATLLLKGIDKNLHGSVSTEVTGTLAGALTALGSETFDLVILDLGLPDSEGVSTLERIRHAAPEAPVIVLTGLDDPAIGAKCIEMGAQNYLVKGCISGAINGVIHNTMAAKSALMHAELAHKNLKHVLDNSFDAILVIDDGGKVRFANRTAKALFCGRVSEGQDIGLALDSGETQELDVIQSDGSLTKVEMRTGETAWFGEPSRIVSFRDISERAAADAELKKQQHLFEIMFDTIPDGVVITDRERKILLANKGMERTFGYNPADLIGQSTEMLYAAKKGFQDTGSTVFGEETERTNGLYVTRYKKADGTEFSGETFGAKLHNANGEWIGNLGIMRDVTEQEQAEQHMTEQLDELRRWHDLTLGRESRVLELKREVNELLTKAGQPPRYAELGAGSSEFGTGSAELGGRQDEC